MWSQSEGGDWTDIWTRPSPFLLLFVSLMTRNTMKTSYVFRQMHNNENGHWCTEQSFGERVFGGWRCRVLFDFTAHLSTDGTWLVALNFGAESLVLINGHHHRAWRATPAETCVNAQEWADFRFQFSSSASAGIKTISSLFSGCHSWQSIWSPVGTSCMLELVCMFH